jgi:hypothetical protein
MVARGETENGARACFAEWAHEDHYLPLSSELALLAEAGFSHPDCWFRRGPVAVFGAFA